MHKINTIDARTAVGTQTAVAFLRSASGRSHPLVAVATRIGRLPDNEIVLDDVNVSRHHAVIIDTGTSFVITDLRSANGVEVGESADQGHGDTRPRRRDPHLRPPSSPSNSAHPTPR